MKNYIVRVYRRLIGAKSMVGVVESTGKNIQEKPFHSANELWEILLAEPENNKSHSKTDEEA